jgi:predicted nuclease with TOPRIM domain
MDIVDKARQWCKTVRTKPTPLSEAIPMVAKLCDENESLRQKVSYLESGIAETLEQEIVDLRKQLAECQKDAERFEFLVGEDSTSFVRWIKRPNKPIKYRVSTNGEDVTPWCETARQAIDEAMSEKG